MKIVLEEIEFILPEATFKSVRDAHTLGRIHKANEISKNLWNYSIRFEDKLIECEIKYTNNHVSKIICACGRNNTKHPCLHAWIAAYWHYKEIISSKKEENSKKLLTELPTIDYSSIKASSAINFIQLSLKLNKSLYAWIRLILTPDSQCTNHLKYYIDILSEFNPKVFHSTKNNKLKLYKDQILALEFLYDQAISDYLNSEPKNAFLKISACQIKISEWLRDYIQYNHIRMLKLNSKLYNAGNQIMKGIKSSELLEELITGVLNVLSTINVSILHHRENLFSILLENANTKRITQQILRTIKAKSNDRSWIECSEKEAIRFLMNILGIEDFEQYILNNKDSVASQSWLALLKEYKENDDLFKYLNQIEILYQHLDAHEIKKECALLIVESLIVQNKIHEYRQRSKRYSIELKNLNLARVYFENYSKEDLLSYIEDFYKIHLSTEFILILLVNLSEVDLLIPYIDKLDDISSVLKFDSLLFKSHWKQLLPIYNKHIHLVYLSQAGQQAFQNVELIRKHIKKNGTRPQLDEFESELLKNHPERLNFVNINS
ncbi:MAG: hypothetical protein IT267_05990 [Saprospiraceae bacterium]|nr:hypothetical protein [Saprospiraceae bacterium]